MKEHRYKHGTAQKIWAAMSIQNLLDEWFNSPWWQSPPDRTDWYFYN